MENEKFNVIKRALTYAKSLYPNDIVNQHAYATGYIAAINHVKDETKHVYRTVARIDSIEGSKCYIVISAIDPRARFVVDYNDLVYALGIDVVERLFRFMIMIDISLENHDVVGFHIADNNVYVGAEWYE